MRISRGVVEKLIDTVFSLMENYGFQILNTFLINEIQSGQTKWEENLAAL